MIHPIFTTALGRPELIAEHFSNYGELVRSEISTASRGLKSRAIAGVAALICALLGLGFAGVAVMLGYSTGFNWSLVIVPVGTLLVAVFAALFAVRHSDFRPFSDVKSQLDADIQALKLAGERRGR